MDAATVITPVEIAELTREGVRLLQTNRVEEAGAFLKQALERARERPAATADALNNLGEWHRLMRQWADAEACYREALGVRTELLGPDAPETGPVLNNLALLFRQTGRLSEAEGLYRQVIGVFERTLGPDDLQLAGVLNNLAQILAQTARPSEAESLMRRVLGIFEKGLGPNHPNVAVALNNLGRLIERLGRGREAEPLARRQVAIFEQFFRTTGEQHAHFFPARRNYYDLLERLGYRSRTAQTRIRALSEGADPGPLPDSEPSPEERPDFDALSRAAHARDAAIEQKDALYRAVFRLPQWHFVARGLPPNVRPYLAANPALVDGVPMLKAFTDTERLQMFARDNALLEPDGSVRVLSLPVPSILPVMSDFAAQGVTHLHFNADDCSDGFYVPLRQVPVIAERVGGRGEK